jgi:hypothetical protein
MAEAYAFREGLMLAQSMGSSSKRIVWRCFILKKTRQKIPFLLIKKKFLEVLQTKTYQRGQGENRGARYNEFFSSAIALAAIYDDCMVLWSGFGNVCVEFCNTETNQTHKLARDAYNYDDFYIWDGSMNPLGLLLAS